MRPLISYGLVANGPTPTDSELIPIDSELGKALAKMQREPAMDLSDQFPSTEGSSKRRVISDPGCKGLYLDIRPTGTSWRYRFTDAHGKSCSVTVGDAARIGLDLARQKVAMLSVRRAVKDLPPGSIP